VNRELEDPFLYEPNELPLAVLHAEYNLRLLSLSPVARTKHSEAVRAYRFTHRDERWGLARRNLDAIDQLRTYSAVIRGDRVAVHARLQLKARHMYHEEDDGDDPAGPHVV
jgi:hypothetical protein